MCSLTRGLVLSETGRVGVEVLGAVVVVVVGNWEEEVVEEASASASFCICSCTVLRKSCIAGAVVERGTSPMGGKVEGRSLYGFGMLSS